MAASDGTRIVFVVLDTVRKDHLSTYGYHRPTSPILDEFAEDALVFDQAVSPAPWTLPVHASLFTGLYPSDHGATQENPYLDGVTTLAESLATEEIPAACYSSNTWISPYTGLTTGFAAQDNFFEMLPSDLFSDGLYRAWRHVNDNPWTRGIADRLVAIGNRFHEFFAARSRSNSKTSRAIDEAIQFMDSRDEFFVFLNLMDAHLPYTPPEEYRELFAPGVDPDSVCQNSKEYNSGARAIDEQEWAALTGLYDGEIRHLDAELGRLFEWLRTRELWDDTLIIVCADHGELLGEHDLFGHEFNLYEPVVNVPLLIHHPSLTPGVHTEQVELLDLYYTILDHAGLESPRHTQFTVADRSLLSPEASSTAERTAFIEYHRPVVELTQLESKASAAGIELPEQSRFYSRIRAARRPHAKYIKNERILDEFYRLDTDPDEHSNRIDEQDAQLDELKTALGKFEQQPGREWTDTDQATEDLDRMSGQARDRLRDLGYLK